VSALLPRNPKVNIPTTRARIIVPESRIIVATTGVTARLFLLLLLFSSQSMTEPDHPLRRCSSYLIQMEWLNGLLLSDLEYFFTNRLLSPRSILDGDSLDLSELRRLLRKITLGPRLGHDCPMACQKFLCHIP
jgi:hypothetical protein